MSTYTTATTNGSTVRTGCARRRTRPRYLLPHLTRERSLLDIGPAPARSRPTWLPWLRVTATEIGQKEWIVFSRATIEARAHRCRTSACRTCTPSTFPDGSFDVVHATRLLSTFCRPGAGACVRWPGRRPGGVVAARDGGLTRPSTCGRSSRNSMSGCGCTALAARRNGGDRRGRRLLSWAQAAEPPDITATFRAPWCFAAPADRDTGAALWSDRITESALARQLVKRRVRDHARPAPVSVPPGSPGQSKWVASLTQILDAARGSP